MQRARSITHTLAPFKPALVQTHTHPRLQEPELYWDRVAYAGWPFDLHNPKVSAGEGASGRKQTRRA
jgi:hypothetical protein